MNIFQSTRNLFQNGQTFDVWTGDVHSYNNSTFDVEEASTGTYMGTSDRSIVATYRPITTHTLTVKQLSGDVLYEQDELTTIKITAEDAPEGQRFSHWVKSGEGKLITNKESKTATFEFGNGDTTLTPKYINVWTITVIGGTIDDKSVAILDEGESYTLKTDTLKIYEKFEGWSQDGPGTIKNIAATTTKFTVGEGDTTITTSVSQYPDKTLTIYWRDPITLYDTLVSQETYTYGTTIPKIEAEIAPNRATFLSWLGDVDLLSPSALASTVSINHLTADTNIIATYYYPESPQYYTLTVYNGYPESAEYATGSQVSIRANTPNEGWEFYKWYGDTKYLVNPDITLSENSIIMPSKAITLYAKFKVVGELALYRISVVNGTAEGTYTTGEEDNEIEHNESGTYIDVPAGVEVTLTADEDVTDWVFDRWDGNFEQAGITDIIKTENPTTFTSVEHDVNIQMIRRELNKYAVYTTNAVGPTRSCTRRRTNLFNYRSFTRYRRLPLCF